MEQRMIQTQESAERIDALLARSLPELTRSAAQRLLAQGAVTKDGAPVKKNYIFFAVSKRKIRYVSVVDFCKFPFETKGIPRIFLRFFANIFAIFSQIMLGFRACSYIASHIMSASRTLL